MNLRCLAASCLLAHTACDPPKPSFENREKLPSPRWEVPAKVQTIGARVEDPDFVLSVGTYKQCDKSQTLSPAEGFERISVPLRIEGRSQRVVPVNALAFHLEDRDGRRFPATLAGCAPSLPHAQLQEGEVLEGEIAFDIPTRDAPWQLVFHPFLIGRTESVARVEVPSPSN